MGLRTKFLISLILVTAGLTLASLLLVRQSVRMHVRQDLAQSLDNSALTFVELQHRREAEAQRTAELIANVPALKAMMTTADPATIQDASADIWRMAGTNLLALSSSSGRLMAVHTAEAEGSPAEVQKLFARSLAPFRGRDWWFLNGRLYEVFLQPIFSGMGGQQNALGVLAIGYEVDRKLAQEVTRIAAGQVAFRFHDQVLVSTLSEAQTRDLRKAGDGGGSHARELELAGETFLAESVPLAADVESPVQVVMLKSYDQATRFLSSLNRLIVAVAVFAVLLGTVFVFFLSHTFTRPLAELLTGVRALEKGDFEYPLKAGGSDEVAQLTRSFDSMRHSLQESQGRMVNAARMEAVGQLAGGVAHDFNNLVTIIKGYTDLLLLQIQPGDAIAGYAEQIKKAGDRAASVTRQLLAFSRKQTTQRELLDLNAVSTGLSKMMKVLIGEDIEVKITSEAGGLRKVFADPGQVEQVLLNLAVNARDAMPRGGRLTIETTNAQVGEAQLPADGFQARPGHYVKLSVSDTGCGMSAATQARIFQPFFTTKETGKGTGLGLTIVYSIVKNSGGFLAMKSELGRGTTFDVYFPESDEQAQPAAERAPERVASRGAGTVLVVEDEDALRGLARESLKLQGYQVLEAANGVQALELFGRYGRNIDLTITDVVMPQMSGVELVERIQQAAPQMRVLFMSGYSDRVDEIVKSNIPLLQKPFTPDQLVQAVAEMLGNGKSRPAGAS